MLQRRKMNRGRKNEAQGAALRMGDGLEILEIEAIGSVARARVYNKSSKLYNSLRRLLVRTV